MKKVYLSIVVLFLSLFFFSHENHKKDFQIQIPAGFASTQLDFPFIKNLGQYPSQSQYYLNTLDHRIEFFEHSIIYQSKTSRFTQEFLGSQKNVKINPLSKSNSKINYYRGANSKLWQEDIPNFHELYYQDLYPNIDYRIISKNSQIKSEFILHPGAKPQDIQIAFSGPNALQVSPEGHLVISDAQYKMIESKPYVYQIIDGRKREIPASYNIKDLAYQFSLGSYDPNYSVIIDPELSYASYYGGDGDDSAYDIQVDDNGFIYIAGGTKSTDLPNDNAYQSTLDTFIDAFIVKIKPDGTSIEYATYMGGDATDVAESLALEPSGTAVIVGTTNSSDFPTLGNVSSPALGNSDGFFARFNPDGTLDLSTYFGGSGGELGSGITVGSNGLFYITGLTNSTDFASGISSFSANSWTSYQDSFQGGGADAYILIMNSFGLVHYFSYLGGNGTDIGRAIVVDSNHHVILAGTTDSSDFPTLNASQASQNNASQDAFITSIDIENNELIFSSYWGGSSTEAQFGLAIDQNDAIWICGATYSSDFPSLNAYQSELSGTQDAYFSQFSSTGDLLYSSYLGGSGEEAAKDLISDSNLNLFVMGITSSNDFPISDDAEQENLGGTYNVFLSKINTDQNLLLYSSYLGGSNSLSTLSSSQGGLDLDAAESVYWVESSNATDFPVKNAFQDSKGSGSNQDAIFAKFNLNGPRVQSSSPLANSENFSVHEPITITFYDDLDESTVTSDNIYLDQGVTSQVTYDSDTKTVNIVPDQRLNANTLYTVTLNENLKESNGNSLEESIELSFTTGSVTSNLSTGCSLQSNTRIDSTTFLAFVLIVFTLIITKKHRKKYLLYSSVFVAAFYFLQTSNWNRPSSINLQGNLSHAAPSYPVYFQQEKNQEFYTQYGPSLFSFNPKHVQIQLKNDTESISFSYEFKKSNPEAKLRGEKKVPFYKIIGKNDPQVDRKLLYQNLIYENIYPNIDLQYQAHAGILKSEFIVQAHANPDQIEIALNQVDSLTLSDSGSLIIQIGSHKIVESKPFVYQVIDGKKQEIASKYILNNNHYSFSLGNYDPSLPLIIDPALLYGSYLGGTGTESPVEVKIDNEGSIYVLGVSNSTDFPSTSGALSETLTSISGITITKLNADASEIIWSTYVGGSGIDTPLSMDIDAEGNPYVAGITSSTDFPLVNAFDTTARLAFFFKLNSDGSSLVYSSFLGGSGIEIPRQIKVNSNGNAYIVGATSSSDFPTTSGTVKTSFTGIFCGSLVKLATDGGSLDFSTLVCGDTSFNTLGSIDTLNGIDLDSEENIYLVGTATTTDFPVTENSYQTELPNSAAAIIAKLNSDASEYIFASYLGGSGSDTGNKIALNDDNTIYITGVTESLDFPTTSTAYQSSNAGGQDAYIAALSSDGSDLLYASYIGGSGTDSFNELVVEGEDIYVAGSTQSDDIELTAPLHSSLSGTQDPLILWLKEDGTVKTLTLLNTSSDTDSITGLAIDEDSFLWAVLSTNDATLNVTNAFQSTLAGSTDIYLTQVDLESPGVSQTSPSRDEINVFPQKSIQAIFTEDMDPSTIDTSSFMVNDGSISGTVSYDSGSRTATFTPDQFLEFASSYKVTLTNSIANLSGSTLPENYIWYFSVTSLESEGSTAFQCQLRKFDSHRTQMTWLAIFILWIFYQYRSRLAKNQKRES